MLAVTPPGRHGGIRTCIQCCIAEKALRGTALRRFVIFVIFYKHIRWLRRFFDTDAHILARLFLP
jgi:hypothetical protein